jgi:hypothetical protein
VTAIPKSTDPTTSQKPMDTRFEPTNPQRSHLISFTATNATTSACRKNSPVRAAKPVETRDAKHGAKPTNSFRFAQQVGLTKPTRFQDQYYGGERGGPLYFKKAEKYIDNAAKCGGADASISHTFKVKDTKHERVDIEVITGKAFTE